MGDPFKKVQPGQGLKIPAAAYNGFVDAANYVRSIERDQGGESALQFRNSGIIKIKNASGAGRSRFHVLGLDTSIINPANNLVGFKEQPMLRGLTPTDAAHTGRFAILIEGGPNNSIRRAVVSGVAIVQIDVVHASHRYADVRNSDCTRLKSSHAGSAEILYKQTGTGDKWAVVRLGPFTPTIVHCRLETNWNKNTLTTGLKVYIGTPGSEVDSGLTISAYNDATNLTASSGTPRKVKCGHNGFGYYLITAEC